MSTKYGTTGRCTAVAARVAEHWFRWPNLQQVVVYRTAHGYISVRPHWPSADLDALGEIVGVYGRDVTVQQIVEDTREAEA